MEAAEQNYKNRAVLVLIAGIPVMMILVATWLWYFVVRGDLDLVGVLGTANRGTLVQPPRQLDESLLVDQHGVVFKNAELEPRWGMLVPAVGGHCDTACEHSLYLTRQIRLALGKDFNRLRRIFVSDTRVEDMQLTVPELSDRRPAPASFSDFLVDEHRGLQSLVLEPGGRDNLLAEYDADPSTWYLVDPGGWIMMSYNAETSYKDVIADLKFLLKNSGE